MYEVVLGVDDDEQRALAQAEAIAELPHADEALRAVIVHVFRENPEGASVHQIGAVRRATEYLEDRGIEVHQAESSGDPADELIDMAAERDADAICVAARRRSPAGKAVFGSVTQAVLLNADCTVIVPGRE